MSTDASTPQPEDERSSTVGYGKPPEATRFKKGMSGNLKGRPKGSLNVATVFTRTLREKVVINEHGQRKRVTKLEAAMKQLINKAASGDRGFIRLLVELARDAEAKQGLPGSPTPDISVVDQEIIADILKRFSETKEGSPSITEANHGDTERE